MDRYEKTCVFLLVTCCFGFFLQKYLGASEPIEVKKPIVERAGEVKIDKSSSIMHMSRNMVSKDCQKLPKLEKSVELINKSLAQEIAKLEESLDPRQLAHNVKLGDGASAIVLFSAVRSCTTENRFLDNFGISERRFVKAVCKEVPQQFVIEPLKILEPAAQRGDLQAMLLFAKNAPVAVEIARARGQLSESENRAVLDRGEQFGISAAKAGLGEAYTLMSFSYYTGLFGEVDLVKAYSYALAANTGGETNDRLSFLYQKLTRDQLKNAVSLVGSCDTDTYQVSH